MFGWIGVLTDRAFVDSWPQMADELLEDMELPNMRSGGNWLTWIFKVVDLKEIKDLHGERERKRLAS